MGMETFVTCAACGARIRPDRPRCLRCNEPLESASQVSVEAPSGSRGRIFAVGGVAALLILGLAWYLRPGDAGQRGASAAPSAASAGNASPSSPTDSAEPRRAGQPFAAPEYIDITRAGTAAFLSGDMVAARQQFETALERKPDDPEALNSLGQVLDRAGDIPGAIARFERAIQLAPDRWAYHFNLAHALGRLNQWQRATAEYREASRLFPDDYATQFNLAMALVRQGNPGAAIPELERAIKLAPAEASFHLALGNSLQSVGRIADARRAFETYLEMEPNAPDAAKVKAHIEVLSAAASAPPAS